MKLYYNILWFEDQPDKIKNFISAIGRILADNGFKLKYDIEKSISPTDLEDLEQKLKIYNPYDLIVFDHDLGKNIQGATIAKNLRHSVYTDMVYYSGNTSVKLREELYKEEIDGVFIVNRNDFVISMSRILEDHINKFSDMNNMRGVFLDAFSKIEQYARESICTQLAMLSIEQRESIVDKAKDYHSKKNESRTKKKDSLNEKNIGDHFFDTDLLDFDFVRRRLASLDNHSPLWEPENQVHKMQKIRNILAHRSYEFDSQTNEVVITTAKGEERFNIERFKDIRKTLLKILADFKIE